MKRKLSAVLLALGLSVSALSMGVYAEETETTAAEQVTEAVSEAAEVTETTDETETELSQEDQLKLILASQLEQISAWSDAEIEAMMASTDVSTAVISSNWNSVKGELGSFVEVTDAQINMDGTAITGHAKYEKVTDDTSVEIGYSYDADTQAYKITWTIDYPKSVLLQQAAMNTVLGLGIVFIALAFLAWLIGCLHIIPDTIEKMSKKNASAPAPTAAPVPAPEEEEEEYVDDLELVAVITAAIAATENTSSDGFVVRSIKKANKKNWQRA